MPALWQALRVPTVGRGEAGVGLVALDLMGERGAREFVEALLAAAGAAARPVRDDRKKGGIQFVRRHCSGDGALRRELMRPEL